MPETAYEEQIDRAIVRDATAGRLFPDVHPVGFDEAVMKPF